MFLLSLIALLLFGGSLVLVLRAVALPRMKAAERIRALEMYGFGAPQPSTAVTQEGPAFAGLAAGLGNLLSQRFRGVRPEELRREILAAGLYRLTPAALLGYRLLGLVLFALLALAAASGASPGLALVTVVVSATIGWLAPLLIVRRRARTRLESIERELPDLIDLLVVTIEAGAGLAASLQLATQKMHGPLASELRLTLQEQRMGRSLAEALQGMLGRADTPGMRSFVRSVTQGESLGVSIGRIMRNLADEMRKRRRTSAEEQAQKAPVKMLFPLVFLILPCLGIVILGPAIFRISDTLGGG
jgi:tight adherence protein C